MTIEVKVTRAHIEWLGNPIHVDFEVMKKLKAAGVPVSKHTFFCGVDHGRLEVSNDDERNLVYRWHPDPKRKAPARVAYDPLNDDEDEEL